MADVKILGKRAPDGAYEVLIVGDIGFFGVDGADLIREINSVKPSSIKFLIYSPGGAVYDAIAAVTFIKEQGIECYAEIYGTCASAATLFAALAGPKRTAVAPGAIFAVHMPFLVGGTPDKRDQQAIDNAAEFCATMYAGAYGWTKAKARKFMEEDGGKGTYWTAEDIKRDGIASELMTLANLAARYNLNQPAMAENKNKLKVNATVKLTTMEAARAAFSNDGITSEVEVDIEKETADAIAEKDARIAELETENAELKAAKPAEGTVVPVAEVEEVKAKATELEATIAENTKAIAEKDGELVKAQAKIKELEAQIPLAKKTVANNMHGNTPLDEEKPSQGAQIVKASLKGANPLMKAQLELEKSKAESK